MEQSLTLVLNGRERTLDTLPAPAFLSAVLDALALRADRIAVELNGELAPRTAWADLTVHAGDKLEIVHFVGGGASGSGRPVRG